MIVTVTLFFLKFPGEYSRWANRLIENCRIFFLSTLLLITVCHFTYAQVIPANKASVWWIQTGLAFKQNTVIDKNFTTIPGNGNTAGVMLAAGYHRKKAFHELALSYTRGTLSTNHIGLAGTSLQFMGIDYYHFYQVYSGNQDLLHVKAGGSINMLYANRQYPGLINNNTSFESACSLSGLAEVAYDFQQILPGFTVSERIIVPFISAVAQPSFGSQYLSGQPNNGGQAVKSFFEANRIASFTGFLRLKNRVCVQKTISVHHSMSFDYLIDYYRISGYREVKSYQQSFELVYKITF